MASIDTAIMHMPAIRKPACISGLLQNVAADAARNATGTANLPRPSAQASPVRTLLPTIPALSGAKIQRKVNMETASNKKTVNGSGAPGSERVCRRHTCGCRRRTGRFLLLCLRRGPGPEGFFEAVPRPAVRLELLFLSAIFFPVKRRLQYYYSFFARILPFDERRYGRGKRQPGNIASRPDPGDNGRGSAL